VRGETREAIKIIKKIDLKPLKV